MRAPFAPRVERAFLGKYRPKIDGRDKASGAALYADDLANARDFPGLLFAKVLRSPYPHARILGLDSSEAERLPGVRAILRYNDPDVAALKKTNAGWTDGVDTVSYRKMMWGTFRDRCVLGDYACWVGDEVGVAVAAESERIAEEALRLVKVDWEILPFVLDPMAAMEPGAPLVHPEISSDNVFPADPFGGGDVFVDKGDVDEGFKRADLVVEGRAVYHNATQNSLDNWCCLVEWKGEGPDRLVQFLRYGPDAHARQPDARPAAPQGARRELLRRRPVRPRRHRRSAILPLHGPARQEIGPACQVPAYQARELPRLAPTGYLRRKGRDPQGRDHHGDAVQVHRERRRLRRPYDVRPQVRPQGDHRGRPRPYRRRTLRVLWRVHEQASRLHDARRREFAVQSRLRPHDRPGRREAGHGPRSTSA